MWLDILIRAPLFAVSAAAFLTGFWMLVVFWACYWSEFRGRELSSEEACAVLTTRATDIHSVI